MSFFAIYPVVGSGGGGGGGVTSINGDTTAAQIIAAGTGISVSSTGGTTTITNTSPGGSGTVTSVSVTTANGVSGTVATATTTPAISLSLGAITPTSVAASGTVTGSNVSGSAFGTNTGDQTITLTSDVTGSGTGSFATTIASNVVSNAKLAQMPAHTIKGNNTGGTANALDLTATQVTAELNQFTTTLQGVVPGSGGGSVNFLRADGAWATPPDTTGITQLTGDVTAGPGSGSQAAALVATSNATLTTLSGLTTASSLASVGTVTSGTWNATTIAINHGGTGQGTASAAFDALSPLTTKGDIVAYSTTNARFPVGADGETIVADSGQALGLRWAPAAQTFNATDVAGGVISYSAGLGSVTGNMVGGFRLGQFLNLFGSFRLGTTAASTAFISLLNGLLIDTASYGSQTCAVGRWDMIDGTGTPRVIYTGGFNGLFTIDNTNNTDIFFSVATASSQFQKDNGSTIFVNDYYISVDLKVKIAGWTSY